MNLIKSKILSFMICFVCIMLTGCGSQKVVKTEPVHEEEIADLDELLEENGTDSFDVKAVVEQEAIAFVLMETWDDDSQWQMIYKVENGEATSVANLEIADDVVTKTMDISMSGMFYILEEKRNYDETYEQIKCLEPGQDEIKEIAIDQYVEKNDTVQFIQFDGDGNLYLFMESGKIHILSEDFQYVREVTLEKALFIDAVRLKDGSIVCVFAKYEADQEILSLCEVDKESGTTKEILQLPEGKYGSDLLFCGNELYDYYIKGDDEIFGGMRSHSGLTPVIRLQDADIVSSEVEYICSVSEDKLFAVKESEDVEFIYIARGAQKAEGEKEILYMASLDCDSVMEKEVADFNRKNKDYRIELKKYGENEDPVNSFLIDLTTGKEYDLVEIAPEEAQRLLAKGVFADLYPFLDSDQTLKRDDFYDNLLKAFEYDGKLYQSVSFVHLYGWVTKKSHLSESGQWNFESFQSYIEQNPGVHIFSDTSAEEILNQMILVSSDHLLDWNHKTCHFDEPAFEEILKLAKKYEVNNSTQITLDDRVPALQENRLLFAETPVSITELYMYWKALGEDLTVVASPFSEHMGVNLYSTMPQLGIVAKSSRQEGAWQFVRKFFTKEYQDISDDGQFLQTDNTGFPIRKDCIDDLIMRFSATEDYEKDGQWITCLKPDDFSISWDGYDIEVGPLEKTQEELLRELLLNACNRQEIDPVIQEIILEESKTYFKGEKDVHEVAKIIQDRVSTFMNE